jgi:hypothetical protein
VPISDSKSAKSSYKSAVLESIIGTFGTRFCTLETLVLDFVKIHFGLSLKGIRLELIQI